MRASQQGASAAPTTDRTCTSTISQSVGVRRSPVDATECQHRASTEHSAPHARSGDARGDARSGDARKCALRRCARAQLRRCAGAHTHMELVLARSPELVELVISWCSSGARGARCSASSSRDRAGTQAAQQGLTGAAALGRPWPHPRVCLVFVLGKRFARIWSTTSCSGRTE